jgi:hypothetical protein
MKSRGLALATLLAAAAPTGAAGRGGPLSPEESLAAEALLHYCRACHGVGALRFIRSNELDVVWQTVQTETVPGSPTLWRDAIAAALDWPQDSPPAPGTQRLPGKEWMPKGVMREAIAHDVLGEETARVFLLRMLRPAR